MAEYVSDANTMLLLHLNGANGQASTIDASGRHTTINFIGTAQLDTAVKKFGSAALSLDGDSDYLSIPNSADWDFDGDFTLELWVKTSDTQGILLDRTGGGGWLNIDWQLFISDANFLWFQASNSGAPGASIGTTASINDNIWHHVAVVRYGNVFTMYLDGVSVGATTRTITLLQSAWDVKVGLDTSGAYGYLNGNIDEVRISKGIARWTSNFTLGNEMIRRNQAIIIV